VPQITSAAVKIKQPIPALNLNQTEAELPTSLPHNLHENDISPPMIMSSAYKDQQI
jgi:hypothetical protein